MTNLLIASVDFLPKMGGISLMTHHLANAFVAAGQRVVVLGPAGAYVPWEYSARYELLEDVASAVDKRTGREGQEQDVRIRALFEAALEQNEIDRVLLLHPFYYGVGALEACEAKGVPCSIFFHGTELKSQLKGQYPEMQAQLLQQKELGTMRERLFYCIGKCGELLANSQYTAALLDGFEIKPSIRVTGCGTTEVDCERELDFSPSYDAAERATRREAFGLRCAHALAFVGRVIPSKRADRLLRMCRACPDFGAFIIGGGSQLDELERAVRSWGIQSRVKFLAQCTESEKWAALRAADFGCLLSEPEDATGQVEGFGIALLEAAAAGAVPVASGTGGMLDIVAHLETGVIVPARDADAAQLLVGIANEHGLMESLSSAAREQLVAKYTWGRVAARVLDGWD